MKKFIFLIFFLFSITSLSAQKIADKKNNVTELKDRVEMYAVVFMSLQGAMVLLNELGVFVFVDDAGKTIEMKTLTAILNFMHKNGWDYINTVGGSGDAAPQMIFKKR